MYVLCLQLFKRLTLTYYPVSISSCHKLPMCEVSEWLGKIKSVSNPQCFTYKVQKVTLTFASDKKSIEFLLSIWWTYVWSLKVIGQNCKSVSRLQGKVLRNHAFTHSRTYSPNHARTAASSSMLFRGENELGLLCFTSQRTFSLLIWCLKKPLLILPPKFNTFTFTWKAESI